MKVTTTGAYKFSSYQNNKIKKNDTQSVSSQNVNFKGFKLEDSFKDPIYNWATNHFYTFSNKLTALILEKPNTNLTYMSAKAKVGAFNEKNIQRGISHLTEHSQFHQSKGDIPKAMETVAFEYGADLNAATAYDSTQYRFGVGNANLQEINPLIKKFANFYKNPLFPEGSLKKEHNVVVSEIKQYSDDPSNTLNENSIKNVFGVKTSVLDLILGSEQSVRGISAQQLRNFNRQYYAPNNTQIYAVTGMKHQDMAQLIDEHFVTPDFMPYEVEPYYTPTKIINKTKIDLFPNDLSDSDLIQIGFAGPKNTNDKEIVAVNALMKVLAANTFSRLNKALSNLGLSADASAHHVSNKAEMPIYIGFKLDSQHQDLQKVFDVFSNVIGGINTKPITKKELDMAKQSIKLDLFRASGDVSEFASQYIYNTPLLSPSPYKNILSNINGLTTDDVQQAAQKFLNTKKASVGIAYPSSESAPQISFLGANTKTVKKILLPNNINVVFNNDSRNVLSSVFAAVESPFTKNAKAGVSEIFAKMVEIASEKHTQSEFAYIKSKNGLDDFEAGPMNYGINLSCSALNERLLDALKTVNESLFAPRMNKNTFNIAKDTVVNDLGSELLESEDRAIEILYKDHPEGYSTRLLKEKIEDVTFEDVKKYYEGLTKNSRVNFVISGPISNTPKLETELLSELSSISKTFSKRKFNDFKPSELGKSQIVAQIQNDITSSKISKIFNVEINSPKDYSTLVVLNKILGSGGFLNRLFVDLREEQKLAYHTRTGFSPTEKFGQFEFYIITDCNDAKGGVTNNIQKSLEGFDKHIRMICESAPTQYEVNAAKADFVTDREMLSDDLSFKAEKLFYSLKNGFGLKGDSKIMQEVKNVSAEDVQNMAKKIFAKPSATSIVTNQESLNKAKPFLEEQGIYKVFEKESD